MNKKIITEKSNVRVQWRDKIENHSKLREKEIKNYFRNKYGVSNIFVDFTPSNKLKIGLANLDETDITNINKAEAQEKIIEAWLKENNIDIKVEDIKRLNKKVETNLEDFVEVNDNKWSIKNLTLENFLSYKDKTTIDFEKLKGITLISGMNFAGKTTILSGLIFLLFNTTPDTSTADEVINRFIDVDFATVTGELVIDGKEYKIERTVRRKWKKDKSSYTTSTELNFYQKDENNEYKLDNEEERKVTDRKIRENIGDMKEFLMTLLCTGQNIFDIIKAKPTERGLILSKFLGLEIFEKKEEIGKNLYKDWRSKSKLDKYSSVDLKNEIEINLKKIEDNNINIKEIETSIEEYKKEKIRFSKEKDKLLSSYNNGIDSALVNLNEKYFTDKINSINSDISNKEVELKEANAKIVKIKEKFDQNKYDLLIIEKNNLIREQTILENEMNHLRNDISSLKSGEMCSKCGQSIKGIDNSKEISKKTEEGLKAKKKCEELGLNLTKVNSEINVWDELKAKYDLNDRLGINRDKLEAELDSIKSKLEIQNSNFKLFNDNIKKIEENKVLDTKLHLVNVEIDDYTDKETKKNRELYQLQADNINLTTQNTDKDILIKTISSEENIAKIFVTYINMVGKNGISKTIIKNTIPILNIELSRLLDDTAEFTVEVDVNIKNNEVELWMVDNETGIKAPLATGSGYEKTVGALALRIVYSKVNALPKPSLLFIDEIFSTVANDNLELIKLFIDKVSQGFDNIFMISHNELVKEWADNIITVKKENKVSTLSF